MDVRVVVVIVLWVAVENTFDSELVMLVTIYR